MAALTTHDRWRNADVTNIHRLTGDRPILVLAPHADDETIGCGGLIQQAVASRIPVSIDIMTDGSRSHPRSAMFDRARLTALRRQEACAAVTCLGADPADLRCWNDEDGALAWDGASADRSIAVLRRRVMDTKAGAVFVPWIDDPHCDHQAAFRLICRALSGLGAPPRLFAYPVWSWTVERPKSRHEGAVYRLDIAANLATKRRALACHASQLGGVITDDPRGFVLGEPELTLFMQPFETFIEVLP